MIASRYHALSGAVAVGRQVVGEAVGSGTPTCCLAALVGGGGGARSAPSTRRSATVSSLALRGPVRSDRVVRVCERAHVT